MRLTTTLFGVFLSLFTFSQPSDTELLQQAYEQNNPMKSIEIVNQIRKPQALGDSLQSLLNLTLGIAHGKMGIEDSALFYLHQCIDISTEKGYDFFLTRASNGKGLVLNHSGKYEEAIEAYQAALTVAEKNEFDGEIATIVGNMAGVYFHINDFESAVKYSKRSLRMAYKAESTADIAYGHLRLAVVYEEIDSLERSISENNKASANAESVKDYVLLTYIEKTLGNIHKKLNQLDSSLYHHKRAKSFAVLEGEEENIASTSNEVARVYAEIGNLALAEEEAMEALRISKKNSYPHQSKLAYDVLYQVALKRNNFKQALSDRNKYIIINDSLNAVETKERVAELEIRYETAKKEKEIIEANAEIERKERFQTFLFIIIGIILVFSTIGILLLVQRFRLKRALLSQEIDTLRVQINSIFGGGSKKLDLSLEQINDGLFKPLSEREYEILNEAISDKTNGEIAETVFVSVNTVKTHLKNVYTKLGVSNRKEALEVLLAKA